MTASAPHPDALWAPWRLAYIKGQADKADIPEPDNWRPGAETGCFLCRAAAVSSDHDRDLGVIERTHQSLVVLNRYPYANGHLLVAPLDHRATLADLVDGELLDLQRRLAVWCSRLEQLLQCQGFNVGLNLGRVAGAGLPGHLHWHIVPRWPGDVNFMTSVAGVRVIPQALESLWEQLREDV